MKSQYLILLVAFTCWLKADAQVMDAAPAGIMISHAHPKGGFMISYSYMNMMMEENLSGTRKVSDNEIFQKNYSMSPEKMKMDMHMLMLMYGLTGRLSFMLMANYNIYKMDMKSYSAGHVHAGSTATPSLFHTHESSGLGDVKFWMLYKLLNGENSSLVFSVGVNLPTGDTHIAAGEHATFAGQRQSYMMQMGTGSYDIMPGLTYYKNQGKIAWSVQALANVRPFNNDLDYHYGNDVTVNAWAAYHIGSSLTASVRTEFFEGGKIKGSDEMIYPLSEPGADTENYGGSRANAYAGINYYIAKSFMRNTKIGIEAGMPFYQNLNGPQMATQYILNAGITKSF